MNKETESKYNELYDTYLEHYDPYILKRWEFFNLLNKYSKELSNDFELSDFNSEDYDIEEYIITNIIHRNCDNAYIYINGNKIEIIKIKNISEKDFNYIVKFCNKYNLDIVNIDDREDDE